ncbi:MAG: nickel-dependent hydrogenase large subunit [Alphaproteobacteria bacterium]|nr:nickel-dependent hydrogenase large subunit [Alphaproteobacteria bacterium]
MGNGLDIAGELSVHIDAAGGRVRAVRIRSTRPDSPARVFRGRTPGEVAALMGMLFSLCGRAQTACALSAMEQALGLSVPAPVRAAREVLRLSEMLTQTVMRLSLDWPRLLRFEPRADAARACLDAERAFERALFGAVSWKTPGGQPFAPDKAAVLDVAQNIERMTRAYILDALADDLRRAVTDAGLAGLGVSDGDIEDGALKRNWDEPGVAAARAAHGAGLLARLESRLADVEALTQAIADATAHLAAVTHIDAPARDAGEGEATVETARGPLSHFVRIADGRIADYRIAAPTDANFVPDGVVARGLAGLAVTDVEALRRAVELHVLAVDPCVGCAIDVGGL